MLKILNLLNFMKIMLEDFYRCFFTMLHEFFMYLSLCFDRMAQMLKQSRVSTARSANRFTDKSFKASMAEVYTQIYDAAKHGSMHAYIYLNDTSRSKVKAELKRKGFFIEDDQLNSNTGTMLLSVSQIHVRWDDIVLEELHRVTNDN